MPLSQDRMIEMIEAADLFYLSLKKIKAFAQARKIESRNSGDRDKADLYDEIILFIDTSLPPPETFEALGRERTHFKLCKRRNEKEKLRQARKRGKDINEETLMAEDYAKRFISPSKGLSDMSPGYVQMSRAQKDELSRMVAEREEEARVAERTRMHAIAAGREMPPAPANGLSSLPQNIFIPPDPRAATPENFDPEEL